MQSPRNQVDRQVETFFAPPARRGRWPGRIGKEHSILFDLRRDLQDLSVYEGELPDNQALIAPNLAALGIMIGFEILACVYQGSGSIANAAKADAFRKFLKVSEKESWLLVHFRDALAHGYQLVARTRSGEIFHFALASGQPEDSFFTPVKSSVRATGPASVRYEVNFWALRHRFLETTKEFSARLANRANSSERNRFIAALPQLRSDNFI